MPKPHGLLTLHRNRRTIMFALPFDRTGGTVMRNHGYESGLDCAVLGTPVWDTGPDGAELIFDGSNDVVQATGHGSESGHEMDIVLSDGTNFFRTRTGYGIRIRFRTSTGSTVIRWLERVSNASGPLVIFNYPSAGQCKFYFNSFGDSDALDATGTPPLNDGKLHEIWFVRYLDNIGATPRARIYLDGVLNAERAQNGAGPTQDAGGLFIGTNFANTNFWIGRMSLFEIHNHPPTARQVASYWADPWQDYRAPDYSRMALVAPAAPTGNRRRRLLMGAT